MTTTELIRLLKKLPETAEVCMDDHNGGLLPLDGVHIASSAKKLEAGRDRDAVIVVISAQAEVLR